MAFFLNLLISLTMMIIGYLIMPKPKAQKPPEAEELEGPTAEAGLPVIVIFGDYRIKSPNFLGWWDKEVDEHRPSPGKKSSS